MGENPPHFFRFGHSDGGSILVAQSDLGAGITDFRHILCQLLHDAIGKVIDIDAIGLGPGTGQIRIHHGRQDLIKLSSWTDTSAVYFLPDGTKTIGTFLCVDQQQIAALGLWEHQKPIAPSDIELVQVLYEVLISTLEAQQRSAPLRSSSAILEDLLSGVQVAEDLMHNLEQKAPGN